MMDIWFLVLLCLITVLENVRSKESGGDTKNSTIPPFYKTYDVRGDFNIFKTEGNKLQFKIRTDGHAHILLLTSAEIRPLIDIKIVSQACYIYKDSVQKASVFNIFGVSEYEFRGFWIEWQYNIIRVGYEDNITPFIEFHDTDPFVFPFFGVTTINNKGYWKFQESVEKSPVRKYPNHIHTYDNPGHYKYFPAEKSPIRFKVKTTRDANMALSMNPDGKSPLYEILIGAFGKNWHSHYTYIRKNGRRDDKGQIYKRTPDIVRKAELKGVWVDWMYFVDEKSKMKITVSVGMEGESDPIVKFTDEEVFPINFIGVTSYKANATWSFQDDTKMICSKKVTESIFNSKYQFFPVVTKPLQLHIKEISNVLIALATTPSETKNPLVEFLIGFENNTKTMISINGNREQYAYAGETVGIFDASHYESFWIDWNKFTKNNKEQMMVYIGLGTDHHHFASAVVDPFQISYFGLRTIHNIGNWHFDAHGDSLPARITTYNHKNQYQFYKVKKNYLKFKVKAMSDAYIALTEKAENSDQMYEIMLGADGNLKSYIKKNKKVPKIDKGTWAKIQMVVDDTDDSIVSSTKFTGFWLEWTESRKSWGLKTPPLRIRIGRQGQVKPFLRWHDENPFPIKFIGFTSGSDNTEWIFEDIDDLDDDYSSKNDDVSVPGSFDFVDSNFTKMTTDKLWFEFFSVPIKLLKFQVKASSEIYIMLTSRPRRHKLFPMYEILIGGRNENSWIRKENGQPEIIVHTPHVLSGNNFRRFWISWDNNTIAVGFKDEQKPFMSWFDPDPSQVNFVAVSSKHFAEWQISDSEFETNDRLVFFANANEKLMFKLQTLSTAQIVLSTHSHAAEPMIKIILEHNNNTVRFMKGEKFRTYNVKDLLDLNKPRGLWISWALGEISVGLQYRYDSLATWKDTDVDPLEPNFIGVSGSVNSITKWQIKLSPVWRPIQWNSRNDDHCFEDRNIRECIDYNYLKNTQYNWDWEVDVPNMNTFAFSGTSNKKQLVNDCDSDRWRNTYQCKIKLPCS